MEADYQAPDCLCPGCNARLQALRLGEHEVDACPTCGGIWFDADELGRLAKSRPGALSLLEACVEGAEVAQPAFLGGRLCPVCRGHLEEFVFPWAAGVVLDGCRRCRGIWADDGELAEMENAARARTGITPAAPAGALEARVAAVAAVMR